MTVLATKSCSWHHVRGLLGASQLLCKDAVLKLPAAGGVGEGVAKRGTLVLEGAVGIMDGCCPGGACSPERLHTQLHCVVVEELPKQLGILCRVSHLAAVGHPWHPLPRVHALRCQGAAAIDAAAAVHPPGMAACDGAMGLVDYCTLECSASRTLMAKASRRVTSVA